MPAVNPENVRITRTYLTYLREARRLSEASVDAAAAAIAEFQSYNRQRSFKKFHIEQAVAFKRYLSRRISQHSGEPLSPRTVATTLNAVRAFFLWLAGQSGYRSRISYADADYFHLPEKDVRATRRSAERYTPTLEQIRYVIEKMPRDSDVEKRDRALVAFALLSGARDGAIASLKLKHIDLAGGRIDQDAREVKTKFSKSFASFFFRVGDDVRAIIVAWIDYLRNTLLFGPDDPLFPATRIGLDGEGLFTEQGLSRQHWATASPIRSIFKTAFEAAGLPYAHPHSFRRTLTRLGEERCQTPEEFKAWSQNLGHEQVLTTFTNYGVVSPQRQAEIIGRLNGKSAPVGDVLSQIRKLIDQTAPSPSLSVSSGEATAQNGQSTTEFGQRGNQDGQ